MCVCVAENSSTVFPRFNVLYMTYNICIIIIAWNCMAAVTSPAAGLNPLAGICCGLLGTNRICLISVVDPTNMHVLSIILYL